MKLSVIMLTYNREKFLRRSLNSILEQTFKEFEVIIINNGSTDNSGEIIKEFKSLDKRINCISIEKSTIAVGRQLGIQMAKGEYITFVDDDDIVEKDMFEFLLDIAQEYDSDVCFCGSYKKVGDKIEENFIFDELLILKPEEAVVELLKRKKCNAALPTKLIRKKLFDKISFNANSVHEDIFVTYKLMALSNKVIGTGVPKYYFYRHPGNISAFTNNDKLLNPTLLEEYFTAFRERTVFLSKALPRIKEYAEYSEWSFMISMYNKIKVNNLTNCDAQLKYIKNELSLIIDKFYNSEYIKDFEIEYLNKYIICDCETR